MKISVVIMCLNSNLIKKESEVVERDDDVRKVQSILYQTCVTPCKTVSTVVPCSDEEVTLRS